MSEVYDKAAASIKRLQEFDTNKLPRIEELGGEMNFNAVVLPAKKLVDLYNRISLDALKDFPDPQLDVIKNNADSDFNLFQQILNFKVAQANPQQQRNTIIQQITDRYNSLFQLLRDIISYSACRTTDFRLIEQQARGVFQSIQDESNQIKSGLTSTKNQAETILEEIRKVAAEQGVSQQALYFKEEYEFHLNSSNRWLKYTIFISIILILVSISFVLTSKWNWLTPKDKFEAIQLIASKVFIFATLSYLLFLCGKNHMNHKHNSILNKHRQNALMTFKAMSDAGRTEECKEIILAQAAFCMFSPQETGYIKVVAGDQNMKTFIESIPKTVAKING